MKHLILFTCLFFTSTAFANAILPQIEVTGIARQAVTPDEIIWNLRVKNSGKTTEEVAKNHLRDVNDVLSFLHKEELPEKDIKTSHMQLRENWVYQNNTRKKLGYIASTFITFTTGDFKKYTSYWTQLSRFQHLEITSVYFGVSNLSTIEENLKIKALLNAKAQAEKLAAALGSSLGKPLSIRDQTQKAFPSQTTVMMARDGAGKSPIAPGEQMVSSTVFAAFCLISP